MGDGTLQLTLREWRGHFLNPIGLIVQACVGAVLGVSGPFGTQDTVTFLPRILYWIWVVYSTYGIGLFGLTFFQTLLKDRPILVQSLVSGCFNGLAISLYIVSLNLLIFGPSSMPYGAVVLFVSGVFDRFFRDSRRGFDCVNRLWSTEGGIHQF